MRSLTSFSTVLILACFSSAVQGQTSGDQNAVPLPAAKHGQPVFSFAGGKRVSVQKTTTEGMHEYSGGTAGGAAGGGTGIVEVGTGSNASGTGITDVKPGGNNSGTGIKNSGKAITVPATKVHLAGPGALTGSTAKAGAGSAKGKAKPATTVVQILGPDGKMQYKEVLFMGTLSPNRKDPNITEVKDGEGKVKEYDWVKKGRK
jgi:hypothetical protein